MCGIFCCVRRSNGNRCGNTDFWPSEELIHLLHCRGPDATGRHEHSNPTYTVTFHSTVLSLRGTHLVQQPLRKSGSSASLCWNGEAWSLAGQPTHGNDTEQIFDLLKAATQIPTRQGVTREDELRTLAQTVALRLSQVAGPYAFVFHDEIHEVLYFGRDFLGRRSLLWRTPDEGTFLLSSVSDGAPSETWTEVDADGIYYLDLRDSSLEFKVVPYHFMGNSSHNHDITSVIPRLSLNQATSSAPSILHQNSPSVHEIERRLRRALELRILNIPDPPVKPDSLTHPPARLAILFSGGLDCTLLALLSHTILPPDEPIDLLNVAFENPRIHKPLTPDPYATCPDRTTGLASLRALQTLAPTRAFRFVPIDVPFAATAAHRPRVRALLHPHNTEMDLSIGLALYFAARGAGTRPPAPEPFTSSARVLLSGLGADELFAGYTRHATAFRRGGGPGLVVELEAELARLGRRNLGRDDRVLAHWGREVRFPFLDEGVVGWAVQAPVWEKCDFGAEGAGEGEGEDGRGLESGKKVLRCLAWKLGMRGVAAEKKRAIQFGSRTAKMESGRTKGTQVLG